MSEKTTQKSDVSVFQIAVMTTICVATLRSLPAMATEGWASVIMYLIPAVLFLVPTALVGAELGTSFEGGVYVWVREAFGNRLGFFAIWLQWIQNVVWFPIQLAFIAAASAFMIGRGDLSDSGIYTGIVIIVVYWLATFLALRGGNLFAKISSIGGLVGTLIPAGLLVVLGVVWLVSGQPISRTLTDSSLLPKITGFSSVALIVSNVLAYAGMEMNAVHVSEMKNPQKDFTRAIKLAFAMILGIFIFPTLAIAVAVPPDKLGMENGIMVAFQIFFDTWRVGFLSNVLAAAMVFGALASVVTWVAGPSRGVFSAAKTGLLPPVLQKQNKHGVQIGVLIPQGIIVTALALIYVLAPNVSDVFLALIGMSAALYVIMYLMMFAAAVVLRKKKPDIPRGYKVPALRLVSAIGFISCALALIMSFIPPDGESAIPPSIYPLIVALVVVLLGVPPLIFYALKKPSWDLRVKG
jgi:putative glutamate/gamma-aminobutyrate antiporter